MNVVNKAGVTPLHDAVTRGDLDVARILLENGAATDIKAKEGFVELPLLLYYEYIHCIATFNFFS